MSAAADKPATAMRGETSLTVDGREMLLRPTYDALVRAEEELGSLFALVERTGDGQLRLAEMSALFWHCLADNRTVSREAVGHAVMNMGVAKAAKPLRTLLAQILQGAG